MKGYVSSTLGNITLKGEALKRELRPDRKGSAAETGRKPRHISHGNPVLKRCKEVRPVKIDSPLQKLG